VGWPLPSGTYRLASPFGWRTHPITGARSHHNGIDLAAPTGTPVAAALPGVVSFAGEGDGPGGGAAHARGGGLVVNVHAGVMLAQYAHLSRIDVRVGQPVAAGARLGAVGSTGRTTGPHLHFGIRIGPTWIDPGRIVSEGGGAVTGIERTVAAARGAGLSGDALVTAVAIAGAESGHNPRAVGDRSLAGRRTPDGRTWGPSIGLWQIRSIDQERGTGRTRDASRLTDPDHNARSMATISNGGRSWSAWSAYTNGAYRGHLARARTAVARFAGGRVGGDDRPEFVTPGPGGQCPDGYTFTVQPGGGGITCRRNDVRIEQPFVTPGEGQALWAEIPLLTDAVRGIEAGILSGIGHGALLLGIVGLGLIGAWMFAQEARAAAPRPIKQFARASAGVGSTGVRAARAVRRRAAR